MRHIPLLALIWARLSVPPRNYNDRHCTNVIRANNLTNFINFDSDVTGIKFLHHELSLRRLGRRSVRHASQRRLRIDQ